MNKLAASRGLTTAAQQPSFRSTHSVCLKKGEAVRRPTPLLPSDINPAHVYGMPGTHRTAEQMRVAGPYDPPMKPLVQNQYGGEWMRMNESRASHFDEHSHYIVPRSTRATRGHMHGATLSHMRTSGAPPCGVSDCWMFVCAFLSARVRGFARYIAATECTSGPL